MKLEKPFAAYNAETNIEAVLVARFLEEHGIPAFAIEDNSQVGRWAFGNLPEIHKPQVWVEETDAEKVTELIKQFEADKLARAKDKPASDQPIQVECEECNKTTEFDGSLVGSLQVCPHCGGYMDVGELDWPFEGDFGASEDEHEVETNAEEEET